MEVGVSKHSINFIWGIYDASIIVLAALVGALMGGFLSQDQIGASLIMSLVLLVFLILFKTMFLEHIRNLSQRKNETNQKQ